MIPQAFNEVLTPEFKSFTSRMWLDYCDENSAFGSHYEDYPTYLVTNFKYLIRRFNANNNHEDWNVK